MERRQFIKSLAAAASTPIIPVGMLQSAKIPASLYASAVTFASSGAYFSANYLKSTLGLDDAVGKAVVSRLKQDGLVGDMGRSGVMFSKTFYAKHIELAAKAVSTAGSAQLKADVLEKVKDVISVESSGDDLQAEQKIVDPRSDSNTDVDDCEASDEQRPDA